MNTPTTTESACTRCGEIHDPWYCNAHSKRTGKQCGNRAGKGTDHVGYGTCDDHLGTTPNGKKNAESLAVQDRVADLLARYTPSSADLDQHAHLLEIVAFTTGMRRAYAFLFGELAPDGTQAYVEYPIQGDGATAGEPNYLPADPAGIYGPDHKGDGKPHVLANELFRWTQENRAACRDAIAAGVAERQVRVLEHQVNELVTVMQGALSAQVELVRSLVGDDVARQLAESIPKSIRGAIEQARERGVIDVEAVDV